MAEMKSYTKTAWHECVRFAIKNEYWGRLKRNAA